MPHTPTASLCTASLKAYLQALQESGVEGVPVNMVDDAHAPPASQPQGRQTGMPAEATVDNRAALQQESLDKIRKDLENCQRCGLGKRRKNIVFGAGNLKARLVFVGEGPGADEDTQGEPFVGEAGRMLTRIITAMGLKREDVYICNVVKCRPPGNRDPETEEIATCVPFLLRQLQSINPEAIVALGKCAADTLLNTKEPISKLRGKFRDYHGIPLMPTYHPSFLLRRQQEGSLEPFWDVWDDMTQVLRLLQLPVPDKNRKK